MCAQRNMKNATSLPAEQSTIYKEALDTELMFHNPESVNTEKKSFEGKGVVE